MKTMGLIGFGDFGRFIAPYLNRYFEVLACDARDHRVAAREAGIGWGSLAAAAAREIVILAVPVQCLETVLRELADKLRPGALVIDVSSVKLKPLALMEKILPPTVELVGLHPLFGPQSAKLGIDGLNIVVCPGRSARLPAVKAFLAEELKLRVLERTAEEHDREMAYVQGVTHFVVRAMQVMALPDCELSTPAYEYLLNIRGLLGRDSQDLFVTIEQENPFAAGVRRQLIETLQGIDRQLAGDGTEI